MAIVVAAGLISCSDDDDAMVVNSLCVECDYTPMAGETAGMVPANLHGTYKVVLDFATPQSPFPVGTTATFVVSSNVLEVAIDGEECITLRNPIQTSPAKWTFVDNCRDDYIYGVSENTMGGLNEINLGTTNFILLGQFKE